MSNLFASLTSAGSALDVFQQALDVTANNVNNANTPGYARQQLGLEAALFEPAEGLPGGVQAGPIQSARDDYADQEVRRQVQDLGYLEQQAASLAGIEGVFDISSSSGIAGALNRLFQNFSAWSVTPNDTVARQQVIDSANTVAQSFQAAATNLTQASVDADHQLSDTVSQINQLAAQIRDLNSQKSLTGQQDSAVDSRIQAALEQLSELVNVTAIKQPNGEVTVLLGGQTPLVVGQNQYTISLGRFTPNNPAYPNATPAAAILDAQGNDVTAQATGGKLGGLLDFRNRFLPTLLGDANQPGDLNRLAKAMADRVNQLLESGLTAAGQAGLPLFTYDAGSDTTVAKSLAVNPAITPDGLAAIDPGPPYASNGIALKLANLATPSAAADEIDGFSYVQFYGTLASRVGQGISTAKDNQDLQTQLVAQARTLRGQISGVSLDEEAVHLVEFQRAYQANAKMVTVLSDLTQTVIDMLGA